MEFRSKEDADRGIRFILNHLVEIVMNFEQGIKDLSFRIKKKEMQKSKDGKVYPVLYLECKGCR